MKKGGRMSLIQTMQIATEAMRAQSQRLNMVASNLANADVSSATEADAYKAKRPVFEEMMVGASGSSVRVKSVATVGSAKIKYDPSDPLANEQGIVWKPGVDLAAEMSDMISASRAYQLNVEVANVSRALINRALNIGQ
jgi:flagellar basal-body rod protein FlgC